MQLGSLCKRSFKSFFLTFCLFHSVHWSQLEDIQKSPAVTKEDALEPTQFLLQYWPSRSSKVDNVYLIWKSLCHFLLVIDSNLDPITHCFRDTATYSLKLSNKNCGQTAADENMVTIELTACKKSPAPYPMVLSPTPYDLPFRHNTSVTDRQMDHDNRAKDACSIAVARQKLSSWFSSFRDFTEYRVLILN